MPAGSVISQSPVGGTQVVSGSAVALVVSSGVAQVTDAERRRPDRRRRRPPRSPTRVSRSGRLRRVEHDRAGGFRDQPESRGWHRPRRRQCGGTRGVVRPTGAALSVDRVVFSDGAGTRVTPAFSTATAGEPLIAFASAAGPTSTSLKQTLTVIGRWPQLDAGEPGQRTVRLIGGLVRDGPGPVDERDRDEPRRRGPI